ncbi:MAG: hypothetical protein EU540_06395 [Promethearchaeota archaeon]|nr:MAG: hypothetical protein EU540_06395 [Candidatus Lokiarchaeota archaeon]
MARNTRTIINGIAVNPNLNQTAANNVIGSAYGIRIGIRAPRKQTSITNNNATQIGTLPRASEPNQLAIEKYSPNVGYKTHRIVTMTMTIRNPIRNMSIFLKEYLKSLIRIRNPIFIYLKKSFK